jgi:hypothetical protein
MDIANAVSLISRTVGRYAPISDEQIFEKARTFGNERPMLHLSAASRFAQNGNINRFKWHLQKAEKAFVKFAPETGKEPQEYKNIMAALLITTQQPEKAMDYFF